MAQELRDSPSVTTITGLMEMNERRCGTIAEASEKLNLLMDAVEATGSKGTLTLKFEVARDKNDELALTIDCDVTATLPKKPRRKALVFHDAKQRAFTKSDPRQMELLAEREAERIERAAELSERGIARIGRGETAS
jgi:hypothetical protein